jgi:hypothetical protein
VDIDFLLEYDHGDPVALIEYKNESAAPQDPKHASFQAMIRLGVRAEVPVFAVRYKSDFSSWYVVPLNEFARSKLKERTTMTERQYVFFLYALRGYPSPTELFDGERLRTGAA